MNATLERLIQEVEQARLEEALVKATGQDILSKAREVAETVEDRVRRVTATAQKEGRAALDHGPH